MRKVSGEEREREKGVDFIKEKRRNVWKGKEVKEPAYRGSDKEITKKHILCSLNFMSNRFNSICNVVVEI